MVFPTKQEILTGLARMRAERALRLVDVHKRYVEFSESIGAKAVRYGQFAKLLKGDSKLDFEQLGPILHGHGVQDFEQFVDLTTTASLEDIKVIPRSKRCRLNDLGEGVVLDFCPPERERANRSRIDVLTIAPGHVQEGNSHEGHEFILVLQGSIKISFSEMEVGEKVSMEMGPGDSIAFPCRLYHSISNSSSSVAEMAIARSSSALPQFESNFFRR